MKLPKKIISIGLIMVGVTGSLVGCYNGEDYPPKEDTKQKEETTNKVQNESEARYNEEVEVIADELKPLVDEISNLMDTATGSSYWMDNISEVNLKSKSIVQKLEIINSPSHLENYLTGPGRASYFLKSNIEMLEDLQNDFDDMRGNKQTEATEEIKSNIEIVDRIITESLTEIEDMKKNEEERYGSIEIGEKERADISYMDSISFISFNIESLKEYTFNILDGMNYEKPDSNSNEYLIKNKYKDLISTITSLELRDDYEKSYEMMQDIKLQLSKSSDEILDFLSLEEGSRKQIREDIIKLDENMDKVLKVVKKEGKKNKLPVKPLGTVKE